MFWFKRGIRTLLLLCICYTSISCIRNEEEVPLANADTYFALHHFFTREVDSLNKIRPQVYKTVGEGTDSESKKIQIADWESELGAFLSVDLSKPAYAGQYRVDTVENGFTYTALSDEVDVREVTIIFDSSGSPVPVSIVIVRTTDNTLYKNREKLSYQKGVTYTMSKEQDILLLGNTHYQIVGKFL